LMAKRELIGSSLIVNTFPRDVDEICNY